MVTISLISRSTTVTTALTVTRAYSVVSVGQLLLVLVPVETLEDSVESEDRGSLGIAFVALRRMY